jgi:nucleotide-binding universal stress UspA family protein
MPDDKRILVGIDGSDAAIRAARLAVRIAKIPGSRITLAMIDSPEDYALMVERESLIKAKEEFMMDILQNTKDEIAEEGIEVDTMIGLGDPAMQLAEIAKGGYGMIVVGRKGLGALKGIFSGSVSIRLAQHSTVPVMIVP